MLVLALDTSTPSVTAGVVLLREPREGFAEPGGASRGAQSWKTSDFLTLSALG